MKEGTVKVVHELGESWFAALLVGFILVAVLIGCSGVITGDIIRNSIYRWHHPNEMKMPEKFEP